MRFKTSAVATGVLVGSLVLAGCGDLLDVANQGCGGLAVRAHSSPGGLVAFA